MAARVTPLAPPFSPPPQPPPDYCRPEPNERPALAAPVRAPAALPPAASARACALAAQLVDLPPQGEPRPCSFTIMHVRTQVLRTHIDIRYARALKQFA